MTYTEKLRPRIVEIVFFVIGVILLLLFGVIASGQTKTAKGYFTSPAAALQGVSWRSSGDDGSGNESKTWRARDEER